MDFVPYIESTAGEKLFRHKVIHLLENKGLLSAERIRDRERFPPEQPPSYHRHARHVHVRGRRQSLTSRVSKTLSHTI